jgi:hypothetical protein
METDSGRASEAMEVEAPAQQGGVDVAMAAEQPRAGASAAGAAAAAAEPAAAAAAVEGQQPPQQQPVVEEEEEEEEEAVPEDLEAEGYLVECVTYTGKPSCLLPAACQPLPLLQLAALLTPPLLLSRRRWVGSSESACPCFCLPLPVPAPPLPPACSSHAGDDADQP